MSQEFRILRSESMPFRRCAIPAALLLLLCVAGLSGAEEAPQNPPLSLEIVPHTATPTGDDPSQHFVVLAKYGANTERDVTLESEFALSSPGKGNIDKAGKFVPSGAGDFRLTARFEGRSATAKIHSEGSAKKLPFSFSRDICEIFTKRGCNGSVCHGGVKGKNGFK